MRKVFQNNDLAESAAFFSAIWLDQSDHRLNFRLSKSVHENGTPFGAGTMSQFLL